MQTEKRFALNLVLDKKRRLLMLRRSPEAKLSPNQWGLPAGKIELGESPREAAEREITEEIGNAHSTKCIRYFGPIKDTYYGGRYEIHLFQHEWEQGKITLNEEHTEYAWVSKEQISAMDVMLGVEEDIAILEIWPKKYLNSRRIPQDI